MKKKLSAACLLLAFVIALTGCATNAPAANDSTDEMPNASQSTNVSADASANAPADSAEPAPEAVTVSPLPVSIDMDALDNCTVAISLAEGDAYVDDTGAMQMDVVVYTYDLYDMVDIAQLKEGDTIVLQGEDVVITALERTDAGAVLINGGLEEGGFDLFSDNSTVFYESGFSDVKSYYALGEATVRVSPDFICTDSSDLDKDPITYYPGDFLTDDMAIDYNFTPHNTTLTIQDGMAISMERVYTP